MKSGRAARAVDRAEPARPHAVEPHERGHVDELDHRRDHHRRQRRLRQALEQAGEEQQRDDRQHRHDEPRHLALRAGAAVDRGLREAAVDDHPARQAGGEVGAAEPDHLAVGVDLVVVPGRVGLGRAEALGEADQRDADRAAAELQVVVEGRVGQAERRQAAVDLADDVDAARVERLDDHDAERRPPRASPARPARAAAGRARARATRARSRASRPACRRACRAGPRAARRSRPRPSRRRTASAPGR